MDFSFELLSFNAIVSNNLIYPYSFAIIIIIIFKHVKSLLNVTFSLT